LAQEVKTVIWTKRSNNDLEKIYQFEQKILGEEKSFELIESLIRTGRALKNDLYRSYLKDEFFAHRKKKYYKHFHYRYKFTYREEANKIYIIRVFDMRRNPNRNK
jgi:plasmid stabilization system protein ParE